MVGTIGRAGSSLNIRLGQSPDIKEPALNSEFQLVFNALHLLSQYMDLLRENLESAPGQTPAESVRFRRRFWAPALQDIAIGSVVSAYGSGIVNGVSTSAPPAVVGDGGVTIGSTGNRTLFTQSPREFFIAVTAAATGELVQVGVGPGILQVTGAKCGQLVWGVSALSCNNYRDANTFEQIAFPGQLVNNGGLYLANITGVYNFPSGGGYQWEGYWLPGFPYNSGGTYYYARAFLFPIGVCVSDSFVLFSDYRRSDPLPRVF